MKKLKLKLDSIKESLSKDQMKRISGGYGDAPGKPTGEGESTSGNGYKCCWENTENCSECEKRARSNWVCVTGAELVAC